MVVSVLEGLGVFALWFKSHERRDIHVYMLLLYTLFSFLLLDQSCFYSSATPLSWLQDYWLLWQIQPCSKPLFTHDCQPQTRTQRDLGFDHCQFMALINISSRTHLKFYDSSRSTNLGSEDRVTTSPIRLIPFAIPPNKQQTQHSLIIT